MAKIAKRFPEHLTTIETKRTKGIKCSGTYEMLWYIHEITNNELRETKEQTTNIGQWRAQALTIILMCTLGVPDNNTRNINQTIN